MKKIGIYILWALLVILVFWVVQPLLAPGFIPTHDGEYHLIRFWQFHKMLSYGVIFPRWAPDLNNGYGIPLFLFHYPFPNYIGSFWHAIGATLSDSVKLTLLSGYAGAVFWCFLWLSRLFPPRPAFLGTVIFMFVPYWFVNMYVRGSVGEMLAICWAFMTLWAIESSRGYLVAIGIALLVVSHNISALLFVPIIALYVFFRRIYLWKAVGLGLGLCAYFWIPALFERQFVTGVNTVNYSDYFPQIYELIIPSWGTGFKTSETSGNVMSVQIGIVPILIGMLSAVCIGKRAFTKGLRKRELFWTAVSIGALFIMLPASQLVWQSVMLLPFVQYPWRFLGVLGVTSAFFGAYVAVRMPVIVACLATLGIGITMQYVRPVTYPPRGDSYYLSRENFTKGTSSLGDAFKTIWQQHTNITKSEPVTIAKGTAQVIASDESATHITATVVAQDSATIRVNTVYYPGWNVRIDGTRADISNASGFIDVTVKEGEHEIVANFGQTPLRRASDAVSVMSLVSLLVLYGKKCRSLSLRAS